jgi:NAD(P)-dependent dehydrogenase (short-subunit alcohol dehydrogenase family)
MTARLKDKIALITGAGTGIGRAIALAFAAQGACVGLAGRRKALLEVVAQQIGENSLVIEADVSKETDVHSVIEQITHHFGGLTTLVNNAGKLHIGTAEQITEEQWDETFNVNVRSVWRLSVAALPHLRKSSGSSIINIASVLGINGARNRAAYAASKGAVVLLTKCMAIDHAPDKIRVNAICPGFVVTELTEQVFRQAADPEALRRERIAVHPAGRLGWPEDVAGLAVYLASGESEWVTGAVLPVDGGYLAV